ncbi:MAG: response regulator [Acidimicrobiia bacterium]|nr:response regulator [Acidimicrobiia bacterium]
MKTSRMIEQVEALNGLKALIVEDSPDDAELLLRHLRRQGLEIAFLRVQTAPAMRQALSDEDWDVVLSDYSMPEFSAEEALGILKESGLDIPFIIVSGTIGEETAVRSLKAGAHDFLVKSQLSRLVPALQREVREAARRRRLRATELRLSETRERMRFALDASGVGTWETELATGATVWSEVFERMHGVAAGGFAGTLEALLVLVHANDRESVRDRLAQARSNHGDLRYEYRVVRADGSTRWIASIGRTFYHDDGRPVRAAGIGIDITSQKEYEEHLRQVQRMESIGNLAGGVAHDFNNLLSVIDGYSHFLMERLAADAEAMADLREVRSAVTRASELTRQLLAFSRRQVLEPHVVSLNDLVGGLQKMLRRLIEENVRIECDLAPGLPPVHVDPGQIDQVLVNLAVNARDAMPDGGVLTIETSQVELRADDARRHEPLQPGPHVALSVRDTGSGMAPDVLARAFEPFFTTKPVGQGTGLGLATVYGIVRQSGGRIDVTSEPGAGTTFRLYFPAMTGREPEKLSDLRAPSAGTTGTETLLVVEDDRTLRILDERILRRLGYEVLMAADGTEARRLCASHAGPVHVLLTDVIIPGGSGPALAEWIVRERPGIRVVYMSGYTDNTIAHHGVLAPGTHFVQKPFTSDQLARKIREALSDSIHPPPTTRSPS